MAEFVTEILTGGLVLMILFWLVPLQVSVYRLKAWRKEVEEDLPELRRLTDREQEG